MALRVRLCATILPCREGALAFRIRLDRQAVVGGARLLLGVAQIVITLRERSQLRLDLVCRQFRELQRLISHDTRLHIEGMSTRKCERSF